MRNQLGVFFWAIVICFTVSLGHASDSTFVPSGTEKNNDMDMQGSDIQNVDQLDTATLSSNQLTADQGQITNIGASQGTVGVLSATQMSSGRALVAKVPTAGADLTNKAYVDDKITNLLVQITALHAQLDAIQPAVPDPYFLPGDPNGGMPTVYLLTDGSWVLSSYVLDFYSTYSYGYYFHWLR